MQRNKSTTKKLSEEGIKNKSDSKNEDTPKFSDLYNTSRLSFNSSEIDKSTNSNEQNSSHSSCTDNPKSSNSANCVKKQIPEFESKINQSQIPGIEIISVREVLRSLGKDVYNTGKKLDREWPSNIPSLESENLLSKKNLNMASKEINVKRSNKTKIIYCGKNLPMNYNFISKKKIVLTSEKESALNIDEDVLESDKDSVLESDKDIVIENGKGVLESGKSVLKSDRSALGCDKYGILENDKGDVLEYDKGFLNSDKKIVFTSEEESVMKIDKGVLESDKDCILESDKEIVLESDKSALKSDRNVLGGDKDCILEKDKDDVLECDKGVLKSDKIALESDKEGVLESNKENVLKSVKEGVLRSKKGVSSDKYSSKAESDHYKDEQNFNNTESCKITSVNDPLMRQHSVMYQENMLGIQTLSSNLADQIFKGVTPKDSQEAQEDFQRSKDHLQAHGLWNKEKSVLPDYDLQLPTFEDQNLDKHFHIVAEQQCAPYKNLLSQLVGADLPCLPDTWHLSLGWTRYNSDGSYTQVDFPDCHAIVFDVEVCVMEGNQPTLATAVSDKYWYSWCSSRLINPHTACSNSVSLDDLIPLESSSSLGFPDFKTKDVPRVVVGHNVSYDRIRVREQYLLEGSSLRFVDTMSLHIASSGLTSEQRTLLMKNKSSAKKVTLPWMFAGCQNSLADVYKFYCKAGELEKSTRNIFLNGSMRDVFNEFQSLMNYCANDVKATHMVLVKLLPIFFKRFANPVTFSGMLEMGLTFLPVTENWNKYIKSAEAEFLHVERLLNEELVKQVQAALAFMEDKKYELDPWLWDLDWSLPKGKVRTLRGYPNWYRKLCARIGDREGTPEPENMSTSLRVVPKLLRLSWNGFPLHYDRQYGWGFLKPLFRNIYEIPLPEIPPVDDSAKDKAVFPVKVLYEMCSPQQTEIKPHTELKEKEKCNSLDTEEGWDFDLSVDQFQSSNTSNRFAKQNDTLRDIGIPGVGFVPLPHKDGAANRVGNPLAKDFLNKIEDGTLSSHFGDIAELVLKTTKTLSYWKNNRDRVLSQMVIWYNDSSLPQSVASADDFNRKGKYGAILPMVVPAGTITRRAVERTWMTASNAYADRIGSELKAMIEAPPGYRFVGADVDSQELWIAAVLGDAYFSGEHGATALGWMTLQGKKSDGTDMHSHTAKNAGISRDHAKIINYGRIYGAGLRFIQRLLKQFNPKLSDAEIKERAENLFATTKGQKGWYLNQKGEELAVDMDYPYTGEALSRKEINKLIWKARVDNTEVTFNDIVERPSLWVNGSESHMFNCLEAIARCEKPRTPVLGGRITKALEPHFVNEQFMTSRVNWVVQSSAVDYLHIMLVCMRWLFTKYDIKGRFCISIHDEVRYLVASEDCYRAALALQITNLLARSLFALRLGFKDLPQSVAFFSGVDIDKVLRKEPQNDCVTPSNPEGLLKGYGIPPGVTLDIQQILQATNGKLNKY